MNEWHRNIRISHTQSWRWCYMFKIHNEGQIMSYVQRKGISDKVSLRTGRLQMIPDNSSQWDQMDKIGSKTGSDIIVCVQDGGRGSLKTVKTASSAFLLADFEERGWSLIKGGCDAPQWAFVLGWVILRTTLYRVPKFCKRNQRENGVTERAHCDRSKALAESSSRGCSKNTVTYLDSQIHYAQVGCNADSQKQVENSRLHSETHTEVGEWAGHKNRETICLYPF